MRYLLFYTFLIVSFYSKAQPLPECAGTINKRLFVKSNENLLSNLRIGNASPSDLDSTINCFEIDYSEIKDSLGNIFFDFKIYRTIENFSDNIWEKKKVPCMHIYIGGLNFKDSTDHYYNDTFTYYIEISKFMKGEFWIDVATMNNFVSVPCRQCIENHGNKGKYINAINITPDNWEKCKK